MSDAPATDTRPAWMLDPSMTNIDEAAIAAVGQQLDDQNTNAMQDAFVSRGMEPEPVISPSVTQDAPVAQGAPPVSEPSVSAPEGAGGGDALPQSISVELPDGTTAELSRDQVFGLLQNYEWMRTRPETVLQAWGGIESGTHHAVLSTEYASFQRWKATEGMQQAVGQRPVDMDDVDPDVARYIAKLEQAAATTFQDTPPHLQPPSSAPGQAPPSAMDLAAQQAAAVQRQVRMMSAKNDVHTDLGQKYGLSAEQLNDLERAVVESNIVPGISMRHAVKNAMGQVIQEGDPRAVFSEAFEATMATHPLFRSIRDEAVYNQRLQQDRQRNTTTDAKKAVAGSLAHTPSAAVSASGTGKSINEMSPQERQAAMVAEITQLIASGESIN